MTAFFLAACFLGSFILSLGTVRFSIRIANRIGALDHPDSERKTQTVPVPRLGGLAVAISYIVVALLAVSAFQSSVLFDAMGVLVPAALLALLGFVDDRRELSPSVRLVAQVSIAALAWILGSGVQVSDSVAINLVISVLWLITIVNGINLLDNSDGLAASTALVVSLGASVIAFMAGQELVLILGLSLVGVSLGFLVLNWFPARVYLGDAGAYFLGFMLAVLAIRLNPETVSALPATIIAILLLVLPIMDTGFVVFRRMAKGIHPFTAGRDHLSHTIQRKGAAVPQTVVLLQIVSLAGAILAIVVYRLAVT